MNINNITNSISLNNSLQTRADSTPEKEASASVSQAIKQEVVKDEVESRQPESDQDIQKVVESLNKSLDPFDTKIKFGVDKNDVYYVSVLEADTNRVLRRFPREQAAQLIPKMQEVAGVLFDEKG